MLKICTCIGINAHVTLVHGRTDGQRNVKIGLEFWNRIRNMNICVWWVFDCVIFPPFIMMSDSHLVGIWLVGICWVTMVMMISMMIETKTNKQGIWYENKTTRAQPDDILFGWDDRKLGGGRLGWAQESSPGDRHHHRHLDNFNADDWGIRP